MPADAFAAAWLDLREPADAAARDPGLLAAARAALGSGLGLDLGCGTGTTVRAFGGGCWRLVDRDPALLAVAATRCPAAETVQADLADLAWLPLDDVALVTASALLDLVSATWLDALAARLATVGVGFYAGLSYDGTMAWSPALAADQDVVAAFNADQRRDKGLGPALGPEAGEAAAHAFARHGYEVRMAPSPWHLGAADAALHAALVEGIAAVAAPTDWRQARLAASAASLCTVGHVDLLALPRSQSKTTSDSRP